MRSKLQYAVKDFAEKRVVFAHDQAVYCFFSSSQSAEEEFAPVEGVERAETFYGVQKLYRAEGVEPSVIMFESAMRADGKLPISKALLKTLVPSGVRDWANKLATHLQRKQD